VESELEDSPQTKKPPSGRRTAAQKEQAKTGTAKKSPSVSSSAGRGTGSDRAAQTQGPDKPADTRKFDTDRKTEPGRMRTAADETGTQPGPGAVQNDDQALSGPVMVPLSQVEPNRAQPRKNFDEDALQELAESVRQYGIIQPLIVQKKDGYYEIIAGERRWRAARIASMKEVPVIIRDYTPREVMEISLIENIQREDLNPIEEAAAFRRLMEEYSLKQDEVAERVSKSRAAIANSVRLLNLDERVQQMVIAEMISTGHARALLALTDPEEQFQTAQRVFDEKLTVRDVEKLVRKKNEAPSAPVKKQISDALAAVYADLSEQMKSTLGTKVSILPKSAQKGRIEIEYYSSDELDRLCTLLNSLPHREEV
jgi:ParB family chromosome partitioning protein